MFSPAPLGRPSPHRQGTRAKRHPRRPTPRPKGLLEVIERRILEAIESGPKTLGELGFHYLPGIKAQLRDEAIESLLKSGRARLTHVPIRTNQPYRDPMPAIALPRGEVSGA